MRGEGEQSLSWFVRGWGLRVLRCGKREKAVISTWGGALIGRVGKKEAGHVIGGNEAEQTWRELI